MRNASAVLIVMMAAVASAPAQADPYRWCAVYGGGSGDDNGTNCYFMTLPQCQAAISGMGGFCTANQFYDGRPVTTPGEIAPHNKPRSRH